MTDVFSSLDEKLRNLTFKIMYEAYMFKTKNLSEEKYVLVSDISRSIYCFNIIKRRT